MKIARRGLVAALIIIGLVVLGSSSAVASMTFPSVGDTVIIHPFLGNANGGGVFGVDILNKGVSFPPPDYLTFCLQEDEFFTYGNQYKVGNISQDITGGGENVPLDPKIAFLYNGFINGTLSVAINTPTLANELQAAIWFIEGEPNGVHNSFVDEAQTAVDPGGVWFGKGLGNVAVVDLLSLTGGDAQDHLTIIPTPEPSAILLFGACLVGLGLFRRHKNS